MHQVELISTARKQLRPLVLKADHLAAFLLFTLAFPLAAQSNPAKEYIRLGGRVIAIESPVVPTFDVSAAAPTISVIPGNQLSNPILLTGMNFTGTVSFNFTISGAATVTGAFSPLTLTANGSTVLTLNVPGNLSPGTYVVVITASSASPSVSRTAQFSMVVGQPAPSTPMSAVFGPSQYLTGPMPSALVGLSTWRFETRLHVSNTLASGASKVLSIGTYRLDIYRNQDNYGQLNYSVLLSGDGKRYEFWTDKLDIVVRAQRSGGVLSLKGWRVEGDGTLVALADPTSLDLSSATTSGFSIGAALDDDAAAGRYPFNGQMAFLRYFNTAANNAVLPDQCDTSSALLRYEFESSLANTGTASAALTPTGTIAYQSTPVTSCAPPGAPPAISLIPGAQSPNPVPQGQSAQFPVVINRQNFTGLVMFTGCPNSLDITCSAPTTTGNNLQVTVATASTTPVGTTSLVLNARNLLKNARSV